MVSLNSTKSSINTACVTVFTLQMFPGAGVTDQSQNVMSQLAEKPGALRTASPE